MLLKNVHESIVQGSLIQASVGVVHRTAFTRAPMRAVLHSPSYHPTTIMPSTLIYLITQMTCFCFSGMPSHYLDS
jgi:hypothetical protein